MVYGLGVRLVRSGPSCCGVLDIVGEFPVGLSLRLLVKLVQVKGQVRYVPIS